MDIKRGLRIPVYGLGCGGADAWVLARAVERAGYPAGRPVEA